VYHFYIYPNTSGVDRNIVIGDGVFHAVHASVAANVVFLILLIRYLIFDMLL